MISCVILTKNSERTIEKVLFSLKNIDEIIIYDTGSTDKTIEIAQKFNNVIIRKGNFEGFGITKNKAIEKAKNDWILSLDSDEELSKNLQQELENISLDENAIYNFPFHNYYNNKFIKCCGWYKESHIRLFNRKRTSFSNDFVHEKISEKNLNIISFKNPINHFSYLCISDFLKKMENYSTLFAIQNANKKKSSFSKAFFHGLFAFFKSYILKRGILYGKEGFIISSYNANVAFYKYLKLWEKNKNN